MAAVRIADAGKAFLTKSPPWGKSVFKMGRLGFLPGAVPPHLSGFLFTKGGVPADCASQTRAMKGATRVVAMNACVSARLKRRTT